MKAENALAQRLKTVAQRYTQSEIARRTGTWVSNVHHYLNGTRVPADFLAALVEKCGVNAQWLLTGEGTPYTADLAPNADHFANDVHKLSRALDAASRLKLGELFTQRRTRVLAEINEALEANEAAQRRVSAHVNGPLVELWQNVINELDAHEKGDAAALARARGMLASMRPLVRLANNSLREIEFYGLEGRLAVYESRFTDALKLLRRCFMMAFSVLGPAMEAFVLHAQHFATSLARNGFWSEARLVLNTALPLARAAGNNPPHASFSDLFAIVCAVESGEIAGAFEACQRVIDTPGAKEHVVMHIAMPFWLDIGLKSGDLTFEQACEFGPPCTNRVRHLLAWSAWTEDATQLRQLLRIKRKSMPPGPNYGERYYERWRRIGTTVYDAAWGRAKGLWRDVLAWDDRAFTCSDERERAVKYIRACQVARLCGEPDKARELLVEAQAALSALPAGMDVFILERATHHRNALALGDGPKGSTKARNLRAQAQRWFRDHAARGYACFSGFGL